MTFGQLGALDSVGREAGRTANAKRKGRAWSVPVMEVLRGVRVYHHRISIVHQVIIVSEDSLRNHLVAH